ncbi:class-II aminoacyl-tRNA synthetase family protein [Streptomyces hiroshimensis]|uniref:Amino acid--[acyl-carrier-protein] ligase 1 n=1 Tax=Streptomyces hiroshimensis TaxID=66424 RepID=A0ABQ2YI93_9ACTN|nr:hypothetical protein [Streptomyces hiroshimensis]GGX83879.1 amino acid--[acyl-carrier-protein] ligase 1 [Streptomyces hiroshimensis]
MTTKAGMPWVVKDGLATLGHEATALLHALDAVFASWGTGAGARAMEFPPLLAVADLSRLDYFRNFPHLVSAVGRLEPDRRAGYAEQSEVTTVRPGDLAEIGHLLPSAACYGAYLHFSGAELPVPLQVTTVATCHRAEEEYHGLQRLGAFRMREVICIGGAEDVRGHLAAFRQRIHDFSRRLGLGLVKEQASDPFFRRQDDARLFFQALEPVKEEFTYHDGTAVASTNYHLNFFGERCGITFAGKPAFTGCAAFGLERWVHALSDRHAGDIDRAREAVEDAASAMGTSVVGAPATGTPAADGRG